MNYAVASPLSVTDVPVTMVVVEVFEVEKSNAFSHSEMIFGNMRNRLRGNQ